MEFGVVKGENTVPLLETHTSGPDDSTPLQMISLDLLTYYRRLDQAARVFLTTSQIEQIKLGTGHPGAPVEA